MMKINVDAWNAPSLTDNMPHGDMPGDKIAINDSHVMKAGKIFKKLAAEVNSLAKEKIVVSVFGGSGVGKSETASLLAYYFQSAGVNAYVLSGDNYPRRIPMYNDAERLSIFRKEGLKGLLSNGAYSAQVRKELDKLWADETDSDPAKCSEYAWLKFYQEAGRKALKAYLGTDLEQDYDEVNDIIKDFKDCKEKIFLKRMGRTEDERWYDEVDFSGVNVLIIEWTHGGNERLKGIDIPILLNSTPEETREHRRLRARDGKTDSAFTTMVLSVEQEELDYSGKFAKIIMSKGGEFIDPATF
ncbi:MAG: adenylylsulfate kinase [Lachnospiraceae bacterium]|nr:adenylylsulfate kinase [Lachnospiraceae bacterium]